MHLCTFDLQTTTEVTHQNKEQSFAWKDLGISIALAVLIIFASQKIEQLAIYFDQAQRNISSSEGPIQASHLFGFDLSKHEIFSSRFGKKDLVGNILIQNGVEGYKIAELEQKSKDVYSVRKLRAGKKYHLVQQDSCGEIIAMIYEPNPLTYVVYDLTDTVSANLYEKQYITCTETVSGKIESSLWNALIASGTNPGIIDQMEDALASSVDFYHTQKGDEFKLYYENKYIDDERVGVGQLIGAYYKNDLGEQYAIYYQNGKYDGYYDFDGRPATSSFLRSPVKFSRVSSGFNLRRFHPIKRRTIPHLGTDYAAPRGTPIRAVADGVVERASRTKNNGNFVKLRHNKIYQTQYLHMQGFAKGIRAGKKVVQGQTIGYVGSTGLATGPHVCFRFWKNGRQVNHRREVFKPADPLPEDERVRFNVKRDQIVEIIDDIPSPTSLFADQLEKQPQ